jgi:hypothetical protein
MWKVRREGDTTDTGRDGLNGGRWHERGELSVLVARSAFGDKFRQRRAVGDESTAGRARGGEGV